MPYRIIDNPPFADGLFAPSQTAQWQLLKQQLPLGTILSGTVFAQAPFGVFLDAKLGFPVLLEVVDFAKADGFMQFPEDYPPLGSIMQGALWRFNDESRQLQVIKDGAAMSKLDA